LQTWKGLHEAGDESVMIDYAVLIKQSVTVPQILAMYGFDTPRVHRIPCPIHHGEKRNFAFWDDRFKCFVCGAHGTVIDLVMQLFNLPFQDALKKIDQDFRLGMNVGGSLDAEKQADAERKTAERIEAIRRKDAERKRLYDAYHDALDRWIEMDKVVQNEAPTLPWDEPTDRFAHALKWISAAADVVDEAEMRLWEFEHECTGSLRGIARGLQGVSCAGT